MACKCIQQMNKELTERYNVVLDTVLQFSIKKGTAVQVLHIPTRHLEGTKRKKGVPLVVPSFCPFCGKSVVNKKK